MIEYVSLAYSENNATATEHVHFIVPKEKLARFTRDNTNNPYVELSPHKIVLYRLPHCYDANREAGTR